MSVEAQHLAHVLVALSCPALSLNHLHQCTGILVVVDNMYSRCGRPKPTSLAQGYTELVLQSVIQHH